MVCFPNPFIARHFLDLFAPWTRTNSRDCLHGSLLREFTDDFLEHLSVGLQSLNRRINFLDQVEQVLRNETLHQ